MFGETILSFDLEVKLILSAISQPPLNVNYTCFESLVIICKFSLTPIFTDWPHVVVVLRQCVDRTTKS